jgi:TolA-binding protein
MPRNALLTVLSTVLLIASLPSRPLAQQTRASTDPRLDFWQAREHFQAGRWSLAYPMFAALRRALTEADRAASQLMADEVDFYATASALRQNEAFAERDALALIDAGRNEALVRKMHFHLGEYLYRRSDFTGAVGHYEQSDIRQLDNREIADMRFHQGDAYFRLERYDRAKPLLQSVRQLSDHPNRPDADYAYGYVCYREQRLSDALQAFRQVDDHPVYRRAVPFYVADIMYRQGQREQALAYAEANASKTLGDFSLQMDRFLGHAYFERREFARALPRLESASRGPERVTREQLYELSYCRYVVGRHAEAADGFSQLSSGSDSLSQSAMYLLGDAYLKLGRKAEARTAFSYCAANSSIPAQREVAAFHFAKLSYELGYQDAALAEFRRFLADHPASAYVREARDLQLGLLAGTNNFREALELLDAMPSPTDASRRLLPRVAFGRAMELVVDQDLSAAGRLLDRVVRDPGAGAFGPPARFWRGEVAYRSARFPDAVKAFGEYLALSPVAMGEATPANARYGLAYAHLRMENWRAAQGLFSQVAGSARAGASPVERDALLREADCRYMLRDLAGARSLYEKVLGYDWPTADYAQYQLAMIAGVTDPVRKTAMLSAFERRFPTSDLVPQAALELASTYLADEKYREAVPVLSGLVRSTTRSPAIRPKALLRLGIAYYNLDRNREALEQYAALVAEYPNAPEVEDALESARAVYLGEGRTADYAEFLRKAGRDLSRDQEDSLTWSVAEARYAEKEPDRAIAAFDDYLRRFPDGRSSADARYLRAEMRMQRNEWQQALPDYQAVADMGASRYADKACQQAARINYFQQKDYAAAETYFDRLRTLTADPERRLDAMRGLLRSQYQLQKWAEAAPNARDLLREPSIGTDDRVLASMVLGRWASGSGNADEAIRHYRSVIALNNAGYAAEARYAIAEAWYRLDDMANAEKAAMETIRKSGSYDYWITKAYILLGDVFRRQKDWFNAKATLRSVVQNSRNADLREEARGKLAAAEEEERRGGRVQGN